MNRRSGYSILEVLIAFAVMSMTLAILLPGQTQLLGRAGTAANTALAHDLALSRIETLTVLGASQDADTHGDWQIDERVTEAPGRRQITVAIRAANGRTLAEVTRILGIADAE